MIDINQKYQSLYTSPNRYHLITGGRGSGKSFVVSLFLCHLTYELGHVILYTRYTLKSAEISIIPEFKEKIELLKAQADFYVTADEIVNVRTGSRIIFRGIKTSSGIQTANLKSIHGVTTWVIDEAEELVDKDIYDTINLSIRTKGVQNRVIKVMNPVSIDHWIYQSFVKGRRDDTNYIHTDYTENKINLHQSFIDDALRVKAQNPTAYKRIFLGEWQENQDGLIYPTWKEYEGEPKGIKMYGLDFGFSNDPCALVELTINGNDVYCKEHIYQTGLTNTDLIRLMKSINIGFAPVYYDSASPDRGTEVFRSGINAHPAKKGQGSIIAGISMLQSKNLFIHRESLNLKKEIKSYSYQKDRLGNALPEPVDYLNHCFIGSTLIITNKGQVAIQDIQEGDYVLTSKGYKEVLKKWDNGLQQISTYTMQLDTFFVSLECTSNHSIKTENAWTPISHLKCNQNLFLSKYSMVSNSNFIKGKDTLVWGLKGFIQKFGSTTKGQSQKTITSIMLIITRIITTYQISTSFIKHFMQGFLLKRDSKKTPNTQNNSNQRGLKLQKNGINQKKDWNGIRNTLKNAGLIDRIMNIFVNSAEKHSNQDNQTDHHTAIIIAKLRHIEVHNVRKERVYDLTIKDEHEYFANGVLVHNCLDSLRYALFTHLSKPTANPKTQTALKPRYDKPTR